MKLISALLSAALLAGCAASVRHETPAQLVAEPGGKETFTVQVGYDPAYRVAAEMMTTCFQRKLGLTGTAQLAVTADKSSADARIAVVQSSLLGTRALYAVHLVPDGSATRVTVYSANAAAISPMKAQLQAWITGVDTRCPSGQTTGSAS